VSALEVLGSGDQLLAVVGGGEDAAVGGVLEAVEQRVGRGPGLGDPAGLARGLGEAGEGVDERGVVGGEGQVAGAAVGLP
jgi:hypothetical protein